MKISIIIVACQAERMPDSVSVGLSESVKRSLPKAAELALKLAAKADTGEKAD
jgi:Ni,Fe-hydrogenase maturation factor